MSARNQEGKLLVLDKFEMPAVKTKDFVATMKRLAADNCLIVVEAMEKNLDLSSRNVIGVKVLPVAGLNVYDILKYDKLMLLQASRAAPARSGPTGGDNPAVDRKSVV